ncbi:MAG: hypothetical protein H0W73_08985 [Bacteroidetes bacterium]|nr:hypothetical protein [Bacteroidota bacterium]
MKKVNPTRYILFIIAAFSFSALYSQVIVNDKDNEYDKKYTPNESSIFNNLNKNNPQVSSSSPVEIKNAIKFSPTSILRLKASFSYQREIYNGIAANLSIGKAFGKDVMQMAYFSVFETYNNNVLSPSDASSYSVYDASSPLVSPSLRVYYSGKSFDEGYVEFGYAFERTDYLLNTKVFDYEVRGSRKCTFKMNAVYFGFGHTFVTGPKNNLIHDLYMNVGIKMFEVTRFNRIEATGAFGATQVYYTAGSPTLSARIVPAFNMGYSFGFGF